MSYLLKVILLVLVAPNLLAQDGGDLNSQTIDSAEQIDVNAIKEPQQPVYKYSGYKYNDLFVPPFDLPEELREKKAELIGVRVENKTQRYSLTDLVLSGIFRTSFRGESILKALIVTPAKEGISLAEGMPIGNKGGRIYQLKKDSIVVREIAFLPDETNTQTFVEREMRLQKYSTRITNNTEQQEDMIYLDPKKDVVLPALEKIKDEALRAKSTSGVMVGGDVNIKAGEGGLVESGKEAPKTEQAKDNKAQK